MLANGIMDIKFVMIGIAAPCSEGGMLSLDTNLRSRRRKYHVRQVLALNTGISYFNIHCGNKRQRVFVRYKYFFIVIQGVAENQTKVRETSSGFVGVRYMLPHGL